MEWKYSEMTKNIPQRCAQCSAAMLDLKSAIQIGTSTYCGKDCALSKGGLLVMSGKKRGRKCSTSQKNKLIHCFDWGGYLEVTKANGVAAYDFHHCCEPTEWRSVCVGTKLEVPLTAANCSISSDELHYWIASIVQIAGYKAKLRYEGLEQDNSHDLWINLLSPEPRAHHVGWCTANNRKLAPPKCLQQKKVDWRQYLTPRLIGANTLPPELYSKYVQSVGAHTFTPGMVLEVVDKSCVGYMKLAKVIETVDCRLHLQYEGANVNDTASDFWCHKNSSLIHPVGWSLTVGHRLHASAEYIESTRRKIQTNIYHPNDCRTEMFFQPKANSNGQFEVGMKLEAIDPLNLSTICVATVMRILKEGYLMIEVDGSIDTHNGSDWFCYHSSSASILPAGFCQCNNIDLVTPPGHPKPFSWPNYLKRTKSKMAPASLFTLTSHDHSLNEGLKLEAVDLIDPRLICVATVSRRVGRLLRIHFDGWEESFDQWVDCESPDIYPIGWCEVMKYSIEGPKAPSSNTPSAS